MRRNFACSTRRPQWGGAAGQGRLKKVALKPPIIHDGWTTDAHSGRRPGPLAGIAHNGPTKSCPALRTATAWSVSGATKSHSRALNHRTVRPSSLSVRYHIPLCVQEGHLPARARSGSVLPAFTESCGHQIRRLCGIGTRSTPGHRLPRRGIISRSVASRRWTR